MSDTIALKEACGHNLYDAHCSAGYEWHVEPHNCEGRVDSRGDLVCEWCPGGRERTFFKTTMLSVVAEPGYFDGMDIWVSERVEVTDEPQMGS